MIKLVRHMEKDGAGINSDFVRGVWSSLLR